MPARRCLRWLPALLLCAGQVWASPDVESRIREIEERNKDAPWQQSATLIEQLGPALIEATPEQRARVELVRLRNLALAGDNRQCLTGVEALLQQDLGKALRLRALGLGANVAVNVGDYFRAFTWLNQGLADIPDSGEQRTALLGHAAYLYAMAGEGEQALTYARQTLQSAEQSGDPRARCLARADMSLALETAGQLRQAERTRNEQRALCAQAREPIFTAQAVGGLGTVLMKQGKWVDALANMRKARELYRTAEFQHGVSETEVDIAEVLVRMDRDHAEAARLLRDGAAAMQQLDLSGNLARIRFLQSELAERDGDVALALNYRKQGEQARAKEQAEIRNRKFAFMQVQFNSKVAEQQIQLLQRDRDLQGLRLKQARQRQWLIATVTALLMVLLVVLGHSLRRTRKERMRYLWISEHDGLTQLCNRQRAYQLGEKAFAKLRSTGTPLTVVMADIDLFKQVNDRFGHAMGDEVLRRMGDWWRDICGEDAIIGRSGGEEFVAFLPIDAVAAQTLVGRMRQRIEPISAREGTTKPTLSFGICELTARHGTLADAVHCADQALYRAKRNGRDQIQVAGDDEPESSPTSAGKLVIVGSGIQMGRHISERTLSEITSAQVVLFLVDPFASTQILALRPDAIDLSPHYADGKDRRQTYREMDADIMAHVRAGKQVCAVFYGHPGVFADVPHAVMRKARAEGIDARMEPGISAEACLYADIGIDPGRHGIMSLEATRFLIHQHRLDTSVYLLLWQVALSGDLSCSRFDADPEGLRQLVAKLSRWYPPEHTVILYEAAVLPIQRHRAERLALRDLPHASYHEFTTLVIPPLHTAARELHASPSAPPSPGN